MFDRLLRTIDDHYSAATRAEFFASMAEAGFARLFALPLLAGRPERSELAPANLERLDMPRLAELRIENRSKRVVRVEARVDFSGLRDLESLFRAFSHATHNAITLGDFRREPRYHARLFSGASYFLFHGDGFCSSLAFMFQAFAKELLGAEVELRYCRTPDSFYTHAYGVSGDLFVDPALKSFWPLADLGRRVPVAWFYTLVKRAGMKRWFDIPESDRAWLFPAVARENLNTMDGGNFQLVYRPDARLAEVHRVFLDTVRGRSEELSIFRDDYPWKSGYREEAARIAGRPDAPFFSHLQKPVAIELPPGATLDVGGPRPSTPEMFRSLMDIFFGRTFARLRAPIDASGACALRTPDLPWLIEANGAHAGDGVRINGQLAAVSTSALAPGRRFVGLSAIEAHARSDGDAYSWRIEGPPGSVVDLWIPINALTWNSPWIRLSAPGAENDLAVAAAFDADATAP